MTRPVAVEARGLGKVYRRYPSSWARAYEALTGRRRHTELVALADVDFSVLQGQGFGLVGENGAGKSTLLKIIAGVTVASSGSVSVRGRVASILELGSGFHPEFTGRQNIVLNAAMLGLSASDLAARLPDIIAFSELGSFIDEPLKCYSSGMAMRLGFSIATQVDPDVLIIDEALSVGDGYFQKKCIERLEAMLAAGKTLLLCSHAMYYISAFCPRSLWLRAGRPAALGATADVVREYEGYLLAKGAPGGRAEAAPAVADEESVGPARISSVRLGGTPGERPAYRLHQPFSLEIEWEAADPGLEFQVGVGVNRAADDVEVLTFATSWSGQPPLSGRRRYRIELSVPSLPLVKGDFSLYVFLLDAAALHVYDQRILRSAFSLVSPDYRFGLCHAEHRWLYADAEAPATPPTPGAERSEVPR